jgi:hypothetical protein
MMNADDDHIPRDHQEQEPCVMDELFARSMADIQAALAEMPVLVLLTIACSFEHIKDDQLDLLLEDPAWQDTYARIFAEIDRRNVREAYDQVYAAMKPDAELHIAEFRRQMKKRLN